MAEETKIKLMSDVGMKVSVELGRAEKSFREVLGMQPGTVIELGTKTGDRIDFLVNGRLVAKGEVMVIDGKFALRVTDVIGSLEKAVQAGLAAAS
ncbi:MAG: FliM/FliN family flagellar motor switch protein [bacterium]